MQYLSFEIGRLGGTRFTIGGILAVLGGLVAALFLAELIARAVHRVLRRRGVAAGSRFAITRLVRYGAGIIAVLVSLSSAGVDLGAVLAASTVVLVGIGLGLQRVAQDLLAGLILLVERPVQKGDFIRVRETTGTVETIGARTTRVVTRDRVTLIVPNSELTSAVVLNYSRPAEVFRLWVRFGVAYGTPPEKVREAALAVARACDRVLVDPEPRVMFEDFGESALKFGLAVHIAEPRDEVAIASELRFGIAQKFAAVGLVMPFPQLDLHLPAPTKRPSEG